MDHHRMTKALAVTSGKDGVGKTNVVANLPSALTKLQKNVLVMDAGLGSESLKSLPSLSPRHNLAHPFSESKDLGEIIIEGPGGRRILPANSGTHQPTNLSTEQKLAFLPKIDHFDETGDVMLIDTEPGISGNVRYFAIAAQKIAVVMCPRLLAIASAYALRKVLACEHGHRKFQLLVNAVATAHERGIVFKTLQLITQQSLTSRFTFRVESAR